ncbi:hypothetical protein [Bacillus cereus]|uniref:hypothetical protein n=1 Tax=Bacillus cereus TaxID=1396 RepID=UPI001F61BCCA|nr:hypothetical protein [Bacillus cereus]
MKHRNTRSITAKTKTKQLQFSNNDAWKYESYYKYQPLFSYKSFLIFFLNFLNVNICAKIYYSQKFSQY